MAAQPRNQRIIPNMADKSANDANIAAIDRLVRTEKYHHILAWGKFLGFTPATISSILLEAETDKAPENAIQKVDGKWLTVDDIENESNRLRVNGLAGKPSC